MTLLLALVAFLADTYGSVDVSCLISGHRLYARPGVVSAHIYGLAADISGVGGTPIFDEAATGRQTEWSASLNWRPTPQVRVAAQYARSVLTRSRDGSRFGSEDIPRLKVEYQATRSIFVRFVGQYTARQREALRDPVSGYPLLINGVLADRSITNDLRVDWLFSYRPSPGTLVYLGYGSTLTEDEPFRLGRDIRRTTDGFFAKVSYVFRT